MYARFFKRAMDFVLSLLALIVLSPIILILMVSGAVIMRGNPFFTQMRPGMLDKNTGEEKIFKIIKFRTMTNAKDKDGELLPDEKRLGKYGKFLRSTSLDELPELINILNGDMSIVGPRPLLVKYLPYYTEEQRKRHTVRPGLTGYAQAHGRNGVDWDKKLEMDLLYIEKITFLGDISVILATVAAVLKRDGVSQEGQATMEDFAEYVMQKREKEENAVKV